MRNIFIAFLSELHYPSKDKFPSIREKEDIKINLYKAEGMEEVYKGLLTDEAATYYVMDELNKKNENLNKIILICTEKVGKEAIPKYMETDGEKKILKQNSLFTDIMKKQINCTEEKYITPKNYYIASVIDYIKKKEYKGYECTQKSFDYDDDKNLPSLFQIISIKDKPQEADIYECMVKVINSLDDEDKLYIDINGGYRDANAILLGLCRVLRVMKPKVKVEQNIYIPFVCRPDEKSEVVNDITDRTFLFSMFDLISGIDEFSQYGSVNKLSEYYENATGGFEKLLKSMKEVSDGLKLCFSDKIIQGFESLKQSFKAFEEQRNDHNELEVFLIDYLKRTYGALINNDDSQEIDLIQLINWCVEHDLVQPALSLCFEKIPDYLEVNKIYYVDANIKNEFVSIVKKDRYENKEWFRIFTDVLSDMKNGKLYKKSLNTIIKEKLKRDPKKMYEEFETHYAIISKLNDDQELKEYIESALAIQDSLMKMKTVGESDKNKRNAIFIKFLKKTGEEEKVLLSIISRIRKYDVSELKSFELEEEKQKTILDYIQKKTVDQILDCAYEAWEDGVCNQQDQAGNGDVLRCEKYCANVNNQTIFSDISLDKLREILERYFEIKEIRNASFHNGELKSNKELDDVKDDIRSLLEAIHTSLVKEEDKLHGSEI